MVIKTTGVGNVTTARALRIRQISFNNMQDNRTIVVDNVVPTLIHLSITNRQYRIELTNIDAVSDILLSFQGLGTLGPPQVGINLFLNNATFSNPLSRIVFESWQFPIDLALPGAAIYGLASAAPAQIRLSAAAAADDGVS